MSYAFKFNPHSNPVRQCCDHPQFTDEETGTEEAMTCSEFTLLVSSEPKYRQGQSVGIAGLLLTTSRQEGSTCPAVSEMNLSLPLGREELNKWSILKYMIWGKNVSNNSTHLFRLREDEISLHIWRLPGAQNMLPSSYCYLGLKSPLISKLSLSVVGVFQTGST